MEHSLSRARRHDSANLSLRNKGKWNARAGIDYAVILFLGLARRRYSGRNQHEIRHKGAMQRKKRTFTICAFFRLHRRRCDRRKCFVLVSKECRGPFVCAVVFYTPVSRDRFARQNALFRSGKRNGTRGMDRAAQTSDCATETRRGAKGPP